MLVLEHPAAFLFGSEHFVKERNTETCISVFAVSKTLPTLPSQTIKVGSSAWLEYVPVTHGVAGSSPVRTA